MDHCVFYAFTTFDINTILVNIQFIIDLNDMSGIFKVNSKFIKEKHTTLIEKDRFLKCFISEDCFYLTFLKWILHYIIIDNPYALPTFIYSEISRLESEDIIEKCLISSGSNLHGQEFQIVFYRQQIFWY